MQDAQPTPLEVTAELTMVLYPPTEHQAGPDTSSVEEQIGASSTEPQ